MQLVEGMDFFSTGTENRGSVDYSHGHSHYHWSYSGSSVSFRILQDPLVQNERRLQF